MTESLPDVVDREPESAAVLTFLTDAARGPAALVVSGEGGIGKTTLWHGVRREAAARGFRVLSTTGHANEIRSAFAGLEDLLADVEHRVIEELAPVQRATLNRVLRRRADGPVLDERAAAVAFRSVVETLAADVPILIAIDDIQWLDTSSALAVRFAARRLDGAIGIVATTRSGDPTTTELVSELQLPSPDAVTRLQMSALTLGGLHALLLDRLGQVPSRPAMMRIHQVSGGNPLYALELARAMTDGLAVDAELPDTLAALVRARLAGIDAPTRRVLLAASCATEPTVDVVAAVTGTSTQHVADSLEDVAAGRIVVITGNRIRFHHPLLATGVYTDGRPDQRRRLHRRLADHVASPELRARHLASAAVYGDTATLEALDLAAETTRARGAPAAAAELLDLAIALGGDTPLRRVQAAEHHFRAGSLAPARELLRPAIDGLPPGPTRCLALLLQGAILGYADDTAAAVQALAQAARDAEDDTELRLHCLLRLTLATVMVDRVDEAVEQARAAVALANRLDVSDLRSRALSIWVAVGFVHGLGVDRPALETALQLEDAHGDATTWYRASAVAAMIAAWTGDLPAARTAMRRVRRQMLDGGTQVDIIWAANHLATIDVWLGCYAEAAVASREAVERAEQMGGQQVLITAWGWQAAVAAYTGRDAEARAAAEAAILAAREVDAGYLITGPTSTLAFLEVSHGDYDAALKVLEPVLEAFDPVHHTELLSGPYLPDAIEALTGVGRVAEADRLVNALHDNGIRLDRPWMLAMAARGRAHCLAARGDLPGAEDAAIAALTHHQRLPMPFERARTQLLLGLVQRRRRRRRDARDTLTVALTAFDDLGTPLWAARTRAELAAIGGTDRQRLGLTPGERRIAELAAAGMSNKEIAAEQFLAVKTVEATLSNVYRKFGIRTRTQLNAHLDGGATAEYECARRDSNPQPSDP